MESISHAIASADRLKGFIHAEVKATDNKVTNAKEASESKAAKTKALSVLRSNISLIDGTLAKLRNVKKPQGTGPKKSIKATKALDCTRALASSSGGTLPDSAKSLLQAMSKGLDDQQSSLQNMAKAIEPIVDRFDDVLTKPYLDNFSATLNTVPVVGLKENQVMYLATKLDTLSGSGTKDEWTQFCALPDGVNPDTDSNIQFFPYKGDFFISVGAAVWRRPHRGDKDPELSQAVDNWPKLYLDKWDSVGDHALAATNLRSVVPFAVLDAGSNQVSFKLLVLQQNGSIQQLVGDNINASNSWSDISYNSTSGSPTQAPHWTRMAYWNNTVVAIDDDDNTWSLRIDFKQGVYTINEKTPIQPTTEFTATDLGPVAVQKDGYLYKRYVEDPPADGNDPVFEWTRWVKQDGVTNLGVASPGVLLDLNVLTKTLKSRYLDTQSALYPVVNSISAFAKTHNVYLDQTLQDIDKWNNAPEDEKPSYAIAEGQRFVAHAQAWAQILSGKITDTRDAVYVMTKQLDNVKTQLAIQLQVLKDKLVSLQNTLNVEEEALSKLQAAFWGMVAAMLLGIALGILALATGVSAWWAVGAGALFVGGLVSMIALSVELGELAGQISDTKAQIDVTNTAISELSDVVQNFTDLDSMYSTLNGFWGGMYDDAGQLKDMDDITAELLGEGILGDTSSIIAAQQSSQEIDDAAQLYLDILNRQGVVIPPESSTSSVWGMSQSPSNIERQIQSHFERGRAELANGDYAKYRSHMEKAFLAELVRQAVRITNNAQSGTWYDIAQLRDAAQLINRNGSSSGFRGGSIDRSVAGMIRDLFDDLTGGTTEIDNQVNAAVPLVVSMLHKTNSMCTTIQELLEKYKQYSSEPGHEAEIAQLKDTLLETALDDCSKAQSYSAQANNAFVNANHACKDYQQGLERQINEQKDKADSARARANQEKNDIYVPWYVYLGGFIAVLAYIESKESEIDNALSATLIQINSTIVILEALENSGATMNGQSLSWIDMAETVSGCLGSVNNTLTSVYGQVLENPAMYESLLNTEWAEVQAETTEVLNILASRGVDINPDHSSRGAKNVLKQVSKPVKTITSREVVETGNSEKPVDALDAPSDLGSSIGTQARIAADFFSEMQTLFELPYLSGIVGYWDEQQADKTSLLDVVTKLQGQYINLMSIEYSAILEISTTSLLQETRAQLVQEGRMELKTFVQSSLISARANYDTVSTVAANFKDASVGYQYALEQIVANMEQIKTKLADIDKNIAEVEGEEREKILGLIGDVVALAFASAMLLAGIGVLGPVAAALTTAQALGLGASLTSAAIKTAIDGMGLAEIEELLGALRSTKRDLETTNTALQAVQPIFASVSDDAAALESTVSSMVDELQDLLDDIGQSADLVLSSDDVAVIGKSWAEVEDSCTKWLDVVNAQGIVPTKSGSFAMGYL